MTRLVIALTRVERWLLTNHRRRTLNYAATHRPPNPTGAGAMTTRRNP